jgi:multidrug efflux system membrane fusion protein
MVPVAAVYKDSSGEQIVWIIGGENTVSRRPDKLGGVSGDSVEIVDGAKAGERIARAGASFLREGMKVRDLGNELGGGQ